MTRRAAIRAAAGAAAILGCFAASAAAGLRVNTTPSVPVGLWRVSGTAASPERGAVVSLCLPAEVAAVGLRLGALGRGFCPGGAYPVLKPLAAVPGDTVEVGPGGVTVNGQWRAPAGAHPRGRYAVPPGHGWVLSDHPHGWDGRHYGAVPLSGLNGVARSVWTTGG